MSSKVVPTPNNPWFGVSMVLIGVVFGYAVATGSPGLKPAQEAEKPEPVAEKPAPKPKAPEAKVVDPVDPKVDRIKGDPDATISVIEYSDFECPFCARHHPTMEKVVEELDDVNWVYRHYPLGFHANAQKASEASECAGDQDKFWEYADILFEKGPNKADLVPHAEELGLDVAEFQDCLDSDKYAQKVKDQMAAGSKAGVSGTPGNIVYNNKTKESRLVSGAQQFPAFEAAIEELR